MPEYFNEHKLLQDVIDKWGPAGAHADCVRWMIEETTRLRKRNDELFVLLNNVSTKDKALRDTGNALVGALENNLMATAVYFVGQWKALVAEPKKEDEFDE